MEQRILQYRRSIDEWLEKTEQSAQTQEDGNAGGITRTEEQDANERERIVRDKLKEHLTQISFFQHERFKGKFCYFFRTRILRKIAKSAAVGLCAYHVNV